MPPRHELAREWFVLAQQDLEPARHLLQRDPPLLETACFHLQQTVEKALKGILLLNGQRPPRTHSLGDLFGLCERWIPGLSSRETDCEWLTACAVDLRYPDSRTTLTAQSANEALTTVDGVFSIILRNVPPEVRP